MISRRQRAIRCRNCGTAGDPSVCTGRRRATPNSVARSISPANRWAGSAAGQSVIAGAGSGAVGRCASTVASAPSALTRINSTS